MGYALLICTLAGLLLLEAHLNCYANSQHYRTLHKKVNLINKN